MTLVAKAWALFCTTVTVVLFLVIFFSPDLLFARNITEYKDLISDSGPLLASNHTLSL
jgi:hypothetical protein